MEGGRAPRVEVMDDPALDADSHEAALRGLARINAWSGVTRTTWRALLGLSQRKRIATGSAAPFRVLDVACGGGDVAVGLNRCARRHARRTGERIVVDGCDVSGRALGFARERAAAAGLGDVRFFEHEALRDAWSFPRDDEGGGYDAAVCTLFLHHLTTADAVAVLRSMGEAMPWGGVVLDLRRGAAARGATWVGVRVFSRCGVVHADGPASVAAGWTRRELTAAALSADLAGARVSRCFPLRWKLVWPGTAEGGGVR